jgi:hypothetical protein
MIVALERLYRVIQNSRTMLKKLAREADILNNIFQHNHNFQSYEVLTLTSRILL